MVPSVLGLEAAPLSGGRSATSFDAHARGITLHDGRTLGYAEFGEPGGTPIIYFHGWPSSRHEARMLDEAACRAHVRLVAPDRPGFGLSTFQPHRSIVDWPSDVLELADALDVETFAILGHSGGSPYAAACALQAPQRARSVGIVSGIGPPGVAGAGEERPILNRLASWMGRHAPWLARLVLLAVVWAMDHATERFFARMAAGLSEADRVVLSQADHRDRLRRSAVEALRQGARGAALENELAEQAWGFELTDIESDVRLWHGERDRQVPVSVARHAAAAMPGGHATFYADEGHVSTLVGHAEEILRSLAADIAY